MSDSHGTGDGFEETPPPRELSSDELLRQARAEMAPAAELPSADLPSADLPSADPPAASPGPSYEFSDPAEPPAPASSVQPAAQAGSPAAPHVPLAAQAGSPVPPAAPYEPLVPPGGAAVPPSSSLLPQAGSSVPAPPDNLGLNLPRTGGPAVRPPAAPKKQIPWRPILIGGGVLAFLLIGWLTTRGTTSASSLDVGDCFMIPESESFADVKDQDCAGLHEAEIYAKAQPPLAFGASGSLNVAADVEEQCFTKLFELLKPSFELPDDVNTATIDGEPNEPWLCVIVSNSGQLQGSILD